MINGTAGTFETAPAEFRLRSMNGQVNTVIEPFTINNVTGDLKTVNSKTTNRNWDHLSGVNLPQVNNRNKFDMLIGGDYPDFCFSLKDIREKPGEPIAKEIQIKLQQASTKINTPELLLAQQMVSL